MSPFIKISAAS